MNFVKWFLAAKRAIERGQWDAAEDEARQLAEGVVTPEILGEIESHDLLGFQKALETMLREASSRAHAMEGVVALYWEFDLDNGWQSGIDLCASFTPNDPDWAGHTLGWVEGPANPHFAQIYAINEFSNIEGECIAALLIVRTLTTFGRALGPVRTATLPTGATYHGSSTIVLFEGGAPQADS